MKKYRAGKIKREHTVIEGLWPVLEQMEECPEIQSIIPGPISRLRGKGFELTFQRFTETGLRFLAKNGSAVQEVYAVAPDREAALKWLAARGLAERIPEPERPQAASAPADARAPTVSVPSDTACSVCGRPILAGSRAVRQGRKSYYYAHIRCLK